MLVSSVPQFLQARRTIPSVKEVHGFEGNEAEIVAHDVDAGALNSPDVEIPGVDEAHDNHTEKVLVAEVGGHNAGKAAQKFFQLSCGALRGEGGTEKAQHSPAQRLVLFVDDRVPRPLDEVLRIHITS